MISVLQLGTLDYATGLRLQKTLVELRHSGQIENVLLLLEHTPVITLGRNADQRNVVASAELLRQKGVELFECDRGGDVTYHGPGQLVGYPIFDLRSFPSPNGQRKTIGAVEYVRRLEEVLIRTCADFGVATGRIKGLTGVWTMPTTCRREAAKVAAIGVHISRGITSHGFALNVNTDLEHFNLIVPCGIATKPVTSLSKQTGGAMSLDAAAESVARNFGRVFNSQILWLETLDALLGRTVGVPLKEPEVRKLHKDETSLA
ncbi:MAG: lipoyl(octanoyl) transferase LipB [Terriglobales bacterium]